MENVDQDSTSIFETSLAELAFILFFILLLFASWQLNEYSEEEEESRQDNSELNERNAELLVENALLEDSLAEVSVYLGLGEEFDPEEMFTKLTLAGENEVRVQELEEQNATLEEALLTIEETASDSGLTLDEIPKALEELAEISEILSEIDEDDMADILPEKVDENDMVDILSEKVDEVVSELRDFRGQNLALRNQLGEPGNGLDHPPCWADETTGKAQYVLNVVMTELEIQVSQGWPRIRNAEVLENANIYSVIGSYDSDQGFLDASQAIYNESVQKECRHIVRVFDHTQTKAAYAPFYDAIFHHFYLYKYENRYEEYERNTD